ncbi:hypothetical protein PR202_ga21915 [Eleusine coracana subsp. coracana]|uniref:Uncharacterized protein n=1 Tax=Eleusine coracana subsp. coracana TaxID=191504 RepID=A0AAV5D269_ELECO|nr:hypothetical protein PR202_ga21915 [Eleusine coracana subsp. coracana]
MSGGVGSQIWQPANYGKDSIIILGAWTLWRHRNDCVFNGTSPNIATTLIMAGDEKCMLSLAGAKALTALPIHSGVAGG